MNIKISYCITCCNELEELKKLTPFLLEYKREEDEIIVLFDDDGDNKVWDYLISIENKLSVLNRKKLNKDFASFKNQLIKLSSGTHLFQIDADEIPNKYLIENLPLILKSNPDTDLYLVPRINTVSNIGLSYVRKMGWGIGKLESHIEEKEFNLDNPADRDEYNLLKEYNLKLGENNNGEGKYKIKFYTPIINIFEPQTRIFRNDKNIKWINRVHEQITGFKRFTPLPLSEEFSLYHPKTIIKQKSQNQFYEQI